MRHLLLVCLGSLLGACGPARVGGKIDGEGVGGARDAFYDTVDFDVGPLHFEQLIVLITDFAEGCEVFEAISETLEPSCDARCEEYLEIADTWHLRGDSFWTTSFAINTSGGVADTFRYDTAVGEGEFSVSFSTWDGAPLQDVAVCEDTCEDGELFEADVEDAEDGELELEEDGDIVHGRFDVGFGGDDGISGSFAARPCDMADWIPFF